jgi:hypothetical protein
VHRPREASQPEFISMALKSARSEIRKNSDIRGRSAYQFLEN